MKLYLFVCFLLMWTSVTEICGDHHLQYVLDKNADVRLAKAMKQTHACDKEPGWIPKDSVTTHKEFESRWEEIQISSGVYFHIGVYPEWHYAGESPCVRAWRGYIAEKLILELYDTGSLKALLLCPEHARKSR
jgi:hypothetical protein